MMFICLDCKTKFGADEKCCDKVKCPKDNSHKNIRCYTSYKKELKLKLNKK